MIIECTHGTTKSRADNIIKNKFEPRQGRAGTGVYFWRKNAYSVILANGWYSFYLNKNYYNDDIDKRFVYLNVKIDVNEDNFLDLEDPELKDRLSKIAIEQNLDRNTKEDIIIGLFDHFISNLEKELKIEFYVWQIRVNAPYDCKEYPLSFLGNPLCYVAKNVDLITIVECFFKEDENEKRIY